VTTLPLQWETTVGEAHSRTARPPPGVARERRLTSHCTHSWPLIERGGRHVVVLGLATSLGKPPIGQSSSPGRYSTPMAVRPVGELKHTSALPPCTSLAPLFEWPFVLSPAPKGMPASNGNHANVGTQLPCWRLYCPNCVYHITNGQPSSSQSKHTPLLRCMTWSVIKGSLPDPLPPSYEFSPTVQFFQYPPSPSLFRVIGNTKIVMALFLILSALLLQSAVCLKVTPGSPCWSICTNPEAQSRVDSVTSTTDISEIVCHGEQFSTSRTGERYKNCLECLENSSNVNGTESDIHSYMCKYP
jgi:hypothetical protein